MKASRFRSATLLALLACVLFGAPAQAEVHITPDVVYGHKDGMALTFDVVQPDDPSGAGVLAIQSGGWYSVYIEPKALVPFCQPLLDKHMTVFIVRHGSAPRYTVPEAIEDVRRSVRVIRMKAGEWKVDAQRLGAIGGSAGGHLTLMLATTGDDGDADAKDPVLRHSSRIAAAVALYPPTDLRGWTTDPPAAIKALPQLKPPLSFDASREPACSPLLHVSEHTAPTLLIHGDKDELVPVAHSHNMIAALKAKQVASELIVIEGAGHSFNHEQNTQTVVPSLVSWFEKNLGAKGE